MKRQEKSGITYLFLGLLTVCFLVAALYLTYANRPALTTQGYTITTSRTTDEVVAPERELIDVNTASVEELDKLSGIGPSLAEAIVAYRTEHGDFTCAEDLLQVKGIGEAKLEGFRNEITIGGQTP